MIISFDAASQVKEDHPDKTIVYAGGCFDLLHVGHLDAIRFAKEQGDILVIGVASDARIKQRKGSRRPIVPQAQRAQLVNALNGVDYVFVIPDATQQASSMMQVVKMLRPDIIIETRHAGISLTSEEQAEYAALGVKYVFDEQPKNGSTSDIINRIVERYKSD